MHPSDPPVLGSFWIGGFEGADHVNAHAEPLDLARSSGHLERLDADLARAAAHGIGAVRESVGWRLCETAPGRYDLARVRRIAAAARRHGLRVAWTLMHYGHPPDVDLRDDAAIPRFAAFAEAAARAIAEADPGAPRVYNPINEIGFLAWAVEAGEWQGIGRADDAGRSGYDVKRRLARAALAGMEAIRRVDPGARFLHVEPLIHVVPPAGRPDLQPLADAIASYQWQAFDLLAGRLEPGLGGTPGALDLVGVNHDHSGQWEAVTEERLAWHRGDPRRRPFAAMLADAWRRYDRPLVVAETSHVGEGRAAWLDGIAAEVEAARARGVPVQGLCLYPLVDRHDWNDASHWHRSGLWDRADDGSLVLCAPYAQALAHWQARLG
jgi:hypothetical protein